MNYTILYSFIIATLGLSLSPGPDNIYVLSQSITNGKKYGMATVVGLITGCLVHASLLALGLSVFIKQYPSLFFGIKLFGVLYLLFLAYKVYSSGKVSVTGVSAPKKTVKQLLVQGFIMNVLNPKVSLFFLAFFPGFLFSDSLSHWIQFYVLGFIFMAVSLVVFGGIALLAGSISAYFKTNKNAAVVFKYLQIFVFIGIATYLLFSAN